MNLLFFVMFFFIIVLLRISIFLLLRHPYVRAFRKRTNRDFSVNKVKTVVVLGSGGHTTELLLVVGHLNPDKYRKYYIIASSDKRSLDRLLENENVTESEDLFYIPRSREVNQSYLTSIFSTLYAFIYSIPLIYRLQPELILCNGPGTCVPICFAAVLLKTLFFCDSKIIFIESICRVKTLSLSARLIKFCMDEVFVQWPELRNKYPDTRYIGRL